ncbi:MAG: hypothetical protein FJX74_01545 [Armatimonadetes bacterium]|nr:hypothetical protein [Armatimonadota bacterium]
MSQNGFLALLFVLVIIGLAGGLWGGFWLGSHLPESMPEALRGILTLLITFGSAAASVGLLYYVAYRIDHFLRRRKKAAAADRKGFQKDRPAKRKRKKR